ncbi:MAG: MltA-interacting MipA family protein [Thermodesulfobacteriota bacterium]
MKQFLLILAAVAAAIGFRIANTFAADATAAAEVNSAYVWRGLTFNDGLVVQPSVGVAQGGFGVNVWGNLDVDDFDGALETGEFSEIDLTLSYGFKIKSVSINLGYIEYLFPYRETSATVAGTRELYAGLGIEPIDGLTTGLTGYWDFDEVRGYYLNLNIGYSRELVEKLTAAVGASAGYAAENFAMAYGGTESGLYDYNFSLVCTYAVLESLSISAKIAYTNMFDTDVLPDQKVNTYGGLGLSYAF